jgi:XTP/dITP diphosphohydrolase
MLKNGCTLDWNWRKEMKKLIIASNNHNKISEIKDILKDFPFEILSLKEAGIDIDIEENGTTFMENALIKASTIFNITNDCYVLADDSGLMVEALKGAPGIYSARFAGEHGDVKKNNKKLLDKLKYVSNDNRKAKFVCAMVLFMDKDRIIKVEGEVHGYIAENESGENGFGYDPLFFLPAYNKTFAEMDSYTKNLISHRANALLKLKEALEVHF